MEWHVRLHGGGGGSLVEWKNSAYSTLRRSFSDQSPTQSSVNALREEMNSVWQNDSPPHSSNDTDNPSPSSPSSYISDSSSSSSLASVSGKHLKKRRKYRKKKSEGSEKRKSNKEINKILGSPSASYCQDWLCSMPNPDDEQPASENESESCSKEKRPVLKRSLSAGEEHPPNMAKDVPWSVFWNGFANMSPQSKAMSVKNAKKLEINICHSPTQRVSTLPPICEVEFGSVEMNTPTPIPLRKQMSLPVNMVTCSLTSMTSSACSSESGSTNREVCASDVWSEKEHRFCIYFFIFFIFTLIDRV